MRESENIELKKSLAELKSGIVSIVSILNKHGRGKLWFGIKNDRHVVGLDVSDKTLRDISQAIAAHIEPKIYPLVTEEMVEGAKCVKIEFEGQETPYYAYGRAYIRVADEDRQLSAKELETLIISKNQERLRWDNEDGSFEINDLNDSKLKGFIERAGLFFDTTENALEKLGLLKKNGVANTARLFFMDSPVELRCALFATTNNVTILDRHDYHGEVLELIEEAQNYILKNIHIGMKINGLYREDVPEISVEALREVIINAFCHRDYRDPDFIQIAIYKDRVEIRSPGSLYGGLTIADLRKGNISRRRNPLIAEMFRRIDMVEAWGHGMPLILENAPDVEFKEMAGIFIAVFRRPSFVEETGNDISSKKLGDAHVNVPANAHANAHVNAHVNVSVSELQQRLLDMMRVDSSVSHDTMAEKTGKNRRTISRNIAKLKKMGVLRHIGSDKKGHWEVLGS